MRSPTVVVVQCVECSREKDPEERAWVTVLTPSGALRIHYCPDCMAELTGHGASTAGEDADGA